MILKAQTFQNSKNIVFELFFSKIHAAKSLNMCEHFRQIFQNEFIIKTDEN